MGNDSLHRRRKVYYRTFIDFCYFCRPVRKLLSTYMGSSSPATGVHRRFCQCWSDSFTAASSGSSRKEGEGGHIIIQQVDKGGCCSEQKAQGDPPPQWQRPECCPCIHFDEKCVQECLQSSPRVLRQWRLWTRWGRGWRRWWWWWRRRRWWGRRFNHGIWSV